MNHKEFNFSIYNTHFYGQYWKAGTTNAVAILVHGMGEHSGRYTHIAEKLNDNNISAIAFDHFGHGKTGGKRGHNPNFEAVLESLDKVIEKATEVFPNKPLFLYGHSMGGNVAANYLLRRKHNFKTAIIASPFLKLAFDPPAIKMFAGKLLQNIMPSITMGNELDYEVLSRDKAEVKKYVEDELVHSKISPNYSIKFLETGNWAIKNADKLEIPTLFIHGTKDSITDHKASKKFVENSKNASIKLFDGGYHELHNDICKEEVLETISNWFTSKI